MARPYTYHYSGQIRNYILQFMRIFSGIQVEYGVDRDLDTNLDRRTVNVHYGDMERVVANVLQKNGKSFTASKLPIMSAVLTGLEERPEDRMSRFHEENVRYIRESDSANMVRSRVMGNPYRGNVDLSIYASNTNQMFQILEQILLMFNPTLNIQKSADVQDWSYLTKVRLLSIADEKNFPVGPDERVLIYTLSFSMDFWLNYPGVEYDKVIQQVVTNFKDNSEADPGGDLETIVIDSTTWT